MQGHFLSLSHSLAHLLTHSPFHSLIHPLSPGSRPADGCEQQTARQRAPPGGSSRECGRCDTGGWNNVTPLTVKPRPSSLFSSPRQVRATTGGQQRAKRRSLIQETQVSLTGAGSQEVHQLMLLSQNTHEQVSNSGSTVPVNGLAVPPYATRDLQPPPTAGGVEMAPVTCLSADFLPSAVEDTGQVLDKSS